MLPVFQEQYLCLAPLTEHDTTIHDASHTVFQPPQMRIYNSYSQKL